MFTTITWIDRKASLNWANHRISFREAATVFDDPLAYTEPDKKHSRGARRFTTVGFSNKNRLIRISHLQEIVEEYDVLELHIISARPPENKERRAYEEGLEGV